VSGLGLELESEDVKVGNSNPKDHMMALTSEQAGPNPNPNPNLNPRDHIMALTSEQAGNKRKEMKRARVMVPRDRKAYYAVATLLMDPTLIPANGEKLNSKNFEQYIPESKKAILERLKDVLLYDC
jgi:hypothetical protein